MHSTTNFIIPKSSDGVLVNRSLEIFLSKVEVQELLLFIKENQDPILREIIAAFPHLNRKDISEILEELITHQLIIRKDRRYYYNVKVLEYHTNPLNDELCCSIKRLVNNYLDDLILSQYQLENIDHQMLEIHLITFIAYSWMMNGEVNIYESIESFNLLQPNMIKTNKSIFVDMTSIDNDSLFLSDYFISVMRQRSLSISQQKIFDIIGDVNRDFFLHQCSRKLQRIRRRGKLQETYNIFIDILEKTGWLTVDDNNLATLNSFVYSKQQSQWFFDMNNNFRNNELFDRIIDYLHHSQDEFISSRLLFTSLLTSFNIPENDRQFLLTN